MVDIDPAALSRIDTSQDGPSSLAMSKSLSISTSSAIKGKSTQTAPRVDIEPLYTALKAAIGDQWRTYKDTISQFLLGNLSQEELVRQTEQYIGIDPQREHMHNQLMCAIHTNAFRDPPEQAVASWVAANDKPTATAKPLTGDAAEQRLKYEVMQLPWTTRKRLKDVQDAPENPITHSMQLHASARRPLTTQAASGSGGQNSSSNANSAQNSATPTATSSSAGLNKDVEIRRRYAQPLSVETRDLPGSSALSDRILPICYEEGLMGGTTAPSTCAELLETAVEIAVKEALTAVLGRVRADAPVSGPHFVLSNAAKDPAAADGQPAAPPPVSMSLSGITNTSLNSSDPIPGITVQTTTFKKQLAKEEQLFHLGKIKRNEAGLLPSEVATIQRHRYTQGGWFGDLQLSWELHDTYLTGMTPWSYFKALNAQQQGSSEAATTHSGDRLPQTNGWYDSTKSTTTDPDRMDLDGASTTLVNGTAMFGTDEDAMMLDEVEWGDDWQGTRLEERIRLNALLDDVLNIGA